jgi:Thrombospondin type 3 repeat
MSRHALAALALCLAIGLPLATNAGPLIEGDGDGIPDVLDKCTEDSRNGTPPMTCDTDQDGYGNVCDADFDQSGTVNVVDFSMYFIPRFKAGSDSPTVGADMDCSGTVGANDFSMFFIPKFKGALGGAIPGPSGLACAGTPGCS